MVKRDISSSQARRFQLTINNPLDNGMNHRQIRKQLGTLKSLVYWCLADEVGDKGTPHTHIYLHSSGAIRFKTIKRRFPTAHIEAVRGSVSENIDYVRKSGKWADSEKGTTTVPGSFDEWGEVPPDPKQSAKVSNGELLKRIIAGETDAEIITSEPRHIFRIDKIDRIRQTIRRAHGESTWRHLQVYYLWGSTGSGKSRFVIDQHGYGDVYRITDYKNPWDGYQGQPVVVFEEFRSSIPIVSMLNFLDGYPLSLPARYANKQALYTTVYIISNIPLDAQYPDTQLEEPETWEAFCRRINNAPIEMMEGKSISIMKDIDKDNNDKL